MQELKDSTNSNREFGYMLFKDSTGVFGNTPLGLIAGPPNKLSLGDFKNYYKLDAILFFALTSSYSVPYLMKVGNITSFRVFCEKIVGSNGNDEIKMRKFKEEFYEKINSLNPDTNEKEFLKLIKNYGAQNGLLLFMGDNNCNNWTKIKIDNFGSVTSVPCSQQ